MGGSGGGGGGIRNPPTHPRTGAELLSGTWGVAMEAQWVCRLVVTGVHAGLGVQEDIARIACPRTVGQRYFE